MLPSLSIKVFQVSSWRSGRVFLVISCKHLTSARKYNKHSLNLEICLLFCRLPRADASGAGACVRASTTCMLLPHSVRVGLLKLSAVLTKGADSARPIGWISVSRCAGIRSAPQMA